MELSWKKFARTALAGFVLGLVVTGTLSYVAPLLVGSTAALNVRGRPDRDRQRDRDPRSSWRGQAPAISNWNRRETLRRSSDEMKNSAKPRLKLGDPTCDVIARTEHREAGEETPLTCRCRGCHPGRDNRSCLDPGR